VDIIWYLFGNHVFHFLLGGYTHCIDFPYTSVLSYTYMAYTSYIHSWPRERTPV